MKSLFYIILSLFSLTIVAYNPPIDVKKVLNSGDGKSIETAFKVNSVDEEYIIMDYLKLKVESQKLIIKDGFFIDVLNANGKTIYFKIIEKKLLKKVYTLTT